jgi:hypothetical protein
MKMNVKELEAIALGQETRTWRVDLTEDEKADIRAMMSDRLMEIRRTESEYAEIKASYSGRIKAMKKAVDVQLDRLSLGYEEITGDTYKVDDQDTGMMLYYDEEGKLVDSRRLLSSERQTRLFPVKEVSND